MMAGLTIDARSDVSDLKEQHENLYLEYEELRAAVSAPIPSMNGKKQASGTSTHGAIIRRNQDVRDLKRVEEKIRSSKGFERFQLPPVPAELMALAEFGPIVCFNVTKHSSDVFMVTKTEIGCMRLPSLQYGDVQKFAQQLTGREALTKGIKSTAAARNKDLRDSLEWLWSSAVKPVLDRLDLISQAPPAKLPRLWWVTSGLMGLLPLHAAGRDWGTSLDNTASHVVSSYIPTFKALRYARQKKLKPMSSPGRELLVVSVPDAKDMPHLDVETEVKEVLQQCKSLGVTESLLETPSQEQVLEKLPSVSIAHFICHGLSEALNPSNSGLLLGDGRLTVRQLTNVSLADAQIAYLSACSTAENKTSELVDESILIASAFHLAGFPHVIGTLFPASNEIAEKVAPKFYDSLAKGLQAGQNDNDSVAYALHEAVKSLWGDPKRSRRNPPSANVIKWMPFIHIGA
jgi:hypothetical protein